MTNRPVQKILHALRSIPGSELQVNGQTSWMARCPAHDDKTPSLAIAEGDNGRALVHCHAGCTVEAVVAALQLKMSDLMPPKPASSPNRSAKEPRNWAAEAARYRKALTAERLQKIATRLGVTPESLTALEVGWKGPDKAFPQGSFTFPERDGSGNIIGINRRGADGTQRSIHRGRRGLVIPKGFLDMCGPVPVVEGASDVAACLTMGLSAVGRPSARSPTYLAEVLADRDFIVGGENDSKSTGSWPGKDGAMVVAKALKKVSGKPVRWALPPDG